VSAVRILFDEDFNGRIIRGVRRRHITFETVMAAETGLGGRNDEQVLDWAANNGYLLVSHDRRTLRPTAEHRLAASLLMRGLILVRQDYPIGRAIDDLVLIGEASTAEEWVGVIAYLPLT
jgi:hypothetical protein